MITRRRLIAVSAASGLAPRLAAGAAWAQTRPVDFPNRTVRLIVAIAAGGPTDIVGRILADQLSKRWGQKVAVENKSGAGSNIGHDFVARADPDGYTALYATASLAVNSSLYRALTYDPVVDFAPVSLVAKFPLFVFVPNSSPVHSIGEFIALAKAQPRKLTMASPGTGSSPHLAEALFMQMAGIQMTHVPYRGAAPAFTDLIPGRLDCYFGSGALLEYSRSGQVRALATTGATRDPAAPELPTIAEAGVPGYEATSWQALFVPAKTPPDIIRKMNADTVAVLDNPAVKGRLARDGYQAGGSSPEQLGRLLKSDIAKWSAVIKAAGIKIE